MFLLGPIKFSRTVVRDMPTYIEMPTSIEIKFSTLELSVKNSFGDTRSPNKKN